MVSSPQRLDWVLSIVVWCGVLPHHQSIDKKPTKVGFFVGCDIPSVDRVAYSLLKNPLIILPYIKEVFNIEESN